MNWKKVTGYSEPEEMYVGKTTVYLRRNIHKTKDGEGNECWAYEECAMSHAEHRHYIEVMSSVEMQTLLDRLNQTEDAQAELLLNQIDIQTTLSDQDDTLAEILLNQM